MRNPLIVLTSDFGSTDSYVGVMKGVILNIAPFVRLIDLTHEVDPQNIKEAAFQLHTSVKYFPEGTIFLTVIDPGVGSNRDAIAFKTDDYYFVAPDNGVLSYIIRNFKIDGVYSLNNRKYHLSEVSSTFHGRDIFAPIAAHIANGVPLSELGKRVSQLNLITLPNPQCFLDSQNIWHGEVIHLDRFGNIVTSRDMKTMKISDRFDETYSRLTLETGEIRVKGLHNSFSEVATGSLAAYTGSSGYLEIAKRNGNAAYDYNIQIGDNVYAYWNF